MPKYLKTWMGTVSGSMAGRDDGYPERKYKVYETLTDLAADPTIEGEQVFELQQCAPIWVKKAVEAERQRMCLQDEAEARAKKEAEYERLKKELGK